MKHLVATLRRRGLYEKLSAIASERFVTVEDVLGRGKTAKVCAARRACMWFLREQQFSLPEIGAMLGRDHTTILYQLRRAHAEAA